MSTAQSNAVKVIALSAASIALLSACGEPKATPMDDEYAGNSGESVQSQENKSKTDGKAADNTAGGDATTKNHADDANSTTSSKQDTGTTRMATIRSTASTGRSARIPSTCI